MLSEPMTARPPGTLVCPVVVMAKSPRAGFAKTRLIPALGPQAAAVLAERLLQHTVREAACADLGPVDLCVTPDTRHPAVVACRDALGAGLSLQTEGDLGARMAAAFARWIGGAGAEAGGVLLIGTDAPAIDAAILRSAAAALQAADAVFIPAFDGGYALIGLRTTAPTLFERMTWSTSRVMADTRVRLAAAGLHHVELAPVADIDEPDDLRHLPADWLVPTLGPLVATR